MIRAAELVRQLIPAICTTAAVSAPLSAAPPTLAQAAKETVVFITYTEIDIETGGKKQAYGTGFIVSNDGLVLTAHHVVAAWKRQIDAKEDKEAAKTRNPLLGYLRSVNARYPVKLEHVASDVSADIALLRLTAPDNYGQTSLCLTDDMAEGTAIEAFGFPLARDFTPFPGSLSNKSAPEGRWSANFNVEYGASGGPVYDTRSRAVFGMVRGGLVRQIETAQGTVALPVSAVSYVTPLSRARTLLQDNGIRSTCGGGDVAATDSPVERERLRQIEVLYSRLLMMSSDPSPPAPPYALDTLSRRYEGQTPDHVGTDASGRRYYGAYRIQDGPNMQGFLSYLNATAPAFSAQLDRAGGDRGAVAGTEAFQRSWMTLAGAAAFDQLQVKFIEGTNYARLRDRVRRPLRPSAGPAGLELDVGSRSLALRAVFFSIAVQYGPSTSLPFDALAAMTPLDKVSDGEIIRALYKARDNASLYFPQLQSRQFVDLIPRLSDQNR